MYRISLWKFYYKLMKGDLPSYFNIIIPTLPVISNLYNIRMPVFHLPDIKHSFAEQLLKYQLILILNREKGSIMITAKVHTHSYQGFKLYLKNITIDSYVNYI